MTIIRIVICFRAGHCSMVLRFAVFHKIQHPKAMAISLRFCQMGTIWSFTSTDCIYLLPTFSLVSVRDLPFLLLTLLSSAGKGIKPNSDPTGCFVVIFFQHCPQTELHSRARKFCGSSVALITQNTWELSSSSPSEIPILVSFRNLS